jgi:hypothetical protein
VFSQPILPPKQEVATILDNIDNTYSIGKVPKVMHHKP